jgi:hypothetical protein
LCLTIQISHAEDNADPQNGRLPALRCNGWFDKATGLRSIRCPGVPDWRKGFFFFAEGFHATIDFTDCFRIAQHLRVESNSALDSRAIIAGHKVERSRSAARAATLIRKTERFPRWL